MLDCGSSVGEAVDLTGGGASAEADRQGNGEAVSILESYGNNLLRGRVRVLSCRCNSRFCGSCGPRRGYVTRQALLSEDVLSKFTEPWMVSLTVDQRKYGSPEDAFDKVNGLNLISKLMDRFGFSVWVRVLEVQTNGWPHWHVVFDVSHIAGKYKFSFSEMVRVWKDLWGVGAIRISKSKQGMSPRHAMMYVSKYLMKVPKVPWPAWLLCKCRVRVIGASKAVGPISGRFSGVSDSASDGSSRRDARPALAIVSECNTVSRLVEERVDPETGVILCKYLCDLSVSKDDLLLLKRSGSLPDDIERGVAVELVSYDNGDCGFDVIMDYSVKKRLEAFLLEDGYRDGVRDRVESRRDALLRAHDEFRARTEVLICRYV